VTRRPGGLPAETGGNCYRLGHGHLSRFLLRLRRFWALLTPERAAATRRHFAFQGSRTRVRQTERSNVTSMLSLMLSFEAANGREVGDPTIWHVMNALYCFLSRVALA
jgi:hypothetical protein